METAFPEDEKSRVWHQDVLSAEIIRKLREDHVEADRILLNGSFAPLTLIVLECSPLSEALVAETVPEALTKEKQKLIINTSSCEQDNCESVACGL